MFVVNCIAILVMLKCVSPQNLKYCNVRHSDQDMQIFESLIFPSKSNTNNKQWENYFPA